jgi:Domain of unknown function (DUF4384)
LAATCFAWLGFGVAQARAQQPTSRAQVRGMFLESRPSGIAPGRVAAQGEGSPLAFGYTLFEDDPRGPKRVGLDHVFHSGDRVRILVETDRSAYLYVFLQMERGSAGLLFPAAQLRGGENRLRAHESTFVPGSGWFEFDNHPGDERLTLIVAEIPLSGVPRGRELTSSGFRLARAQLERLVAGAGAVSTATQNDGGTRMTPAEGRRGLILTSGDPPPSKIVMKKSAKPGWVVARLALIHR